MQRLQDAGLEPRAALGLFVDDQRALLQPAAGGEPLVSGRLGRNYLTCRQSQWVQLLLGHADVRQLVAAGRIGASTQTAVELAAALFPPLPLWHPPLDDLLA